MRKAIQIVLAVGGFVALVFGVTFLSSYAPTVNPNAEVKLPTAGELPPLRFGITIAKPDPSIPSLRYWPAKYEIDSDGHFDFWYANTHPEPVTVRIARISCQCGGADVVTLPPEVWKDYLQALALGNMLGGGVQPYLSIWAMERLRTGLQSAELSKEEGKPGKVIPGASKEGPQMGFIRMRWRTKPEREASRRLTMTLAANLAGKPERGLDLEANFTLVPHFQVALRGKEVSEFNIGDLQPQSTKSIEYICWSGTRPNLDLTASLSGPSTTANVIDCSPLTELSIAERLAFARETGGQTVKSAYRGVIVLHERTPTGQLDLGPLELRLTLRDTGDRRLEIPIVGSVRGELRLSGDGLAKDAIDFGTFPTDEPKSKTVTLVLDRPGSTLEVVRNETSPELTAEPLAENARQWRLKVMLPAGKAQGMLTLRVTLLVKPPDGPARKMRIPVLGNAFENGKSGF